MREQIHSTTDDVTEVTQAGRKPIWNYVEAVEPVSKSPKPRPEMLTPSAKHRYAILIAVMVIGAVLLGPTIQLQPLIGAAAIGWALGQFLPWDLPR